MFNQVLNINESI
uniref:Uncharacterized protein n=1 Tax=Lepeophtheirus salmonis TaxID=72036 RepID=A0A0K2VI47_LEPSM